MLIEHQSSTDHLMPYRMLGYVMRIWDAYRNKHPKTRTLPLVIPLVVHHNRHPWVGPTNISDLIDVDQEMAKKLSEYLPRFTFLLDDLAVVDEDALRARTMTPQARLTLMLLKAARTTHDSPMTCDAGPTTSPLFCSVLAELTTSPLS